MAFFGNKVSASEAEEMGLIYNSVSDDEFNSVVEKTASSFFNY